MTISWLTRSTNLRKKTNGEQDLHLEMTVTALNDRFIQSYNLRPQRPSFDQTMSSCHNRTCPLRTFVTKIGILNPIFRIDYLFSDETSI